MKSARGPEPTGWRAWVNINTLGLALLVITIIISTWRVHTIQREEFDPHDTVLRLCHWQLELGYRSAIDAVIAEYERTHPGVKVRQIAVTERVYQNWLNTHLLAKDAPDLCEMGSANMSNNPGYVGRYFIPLTEQIDYPNPYNKGTDLETVPWRETYIDGMFGGYKAELQDFFGAPTAIFPQRLFINKNILLAAKAALRARPAAPGRPAEAWLADEQPPRTLGELLALCDAIKALPRPAGRKPLTPIAGSAYSAHMFVDPYLVAFTANYEDQFDLNVSGEVDGFEVYTALLKGQTSMQTPEVKAAYTCVKQICDNFAPGFFGQDRQSTAFSFVQGNSAMIASGAWDAESLFEQAQFPILVFKFPLPGPDEPLGKYVAGKASEANELAGGTFGVFKYSRHQEQAIDFLRFLTCRQMNTLFAKKAGWVPAIVGATTAPRMRPFMPDPLGFHPNTKVKLAWWGDIKTAYDGAEAQFLQGEFDYDAFAKRADQIARDPGKSGSDARWAKEYDEQLMNNREAERMLAMQLVRQLMDPAAKDAHAKYLRALSQHVRNNNGLTLARYYLDVRGQPIARN